MNKRYIMGAVAAALIVVGVLVGISLAGRGDDTVSAIAGADAVKAELKGIPHAGNVLGKADAPVSIVEYGDTSCPICKDAAETSVAEVITQFVRPGKAKITFSPVAFISPSSERGALAIEAAGMQDSGFALAHLIYANQGPEREDWLSDDLLREAVKELGLDVDRWQRDYDSEAVASAYFESDAAWRAAGGTGTPTFVITGPRGTKTFAGAEGIAKFEEAIAEVGPG